MGQMHNTKRLKVMAAAAFMITAVSAAADTAVAAEQKTGVSFDYTEETQTADDGTVISDVSYSEPAVTVEGSSGITGMIAGCMDRLRLDFNAESSRIRHMAIEDYRQKLDQASGKSQKVSDTFSPYTITQDYTRGRMDSSVISICACRTEYTGDDHGDYSYTGYNYDAQTGRELSLSDITYDTDKLRRICTEEIKRQCGGISGAYTDDAGDAVTDGAWYFTKAGICFTANPYLLAPYAQGALKFTVPYSELGCLKSRYRYSGNLCIAVRTGEQAKADLDGDGKDDTVEFSMKPDSTGNSYVPHLKIDGDDFGSVLEKDDVALSSLYGAVYYIVDLDISDKYTEIAVLDDGYGDTGATSFFRYNGKKVTFLGKVGDELLGNTCDAQGDGTVSAAERIDILETAEAGFTYELRSGELKRRTDDWYVIDQSNVPESYRSHKILRKVTAYEYKDRGSAKTVLTPADGPVSFTETDNEHWVKVKTASDKEYCIYLEDRTTVDTDGKKIDTADIFDNLYLAD